jgi:prepilin-type N-terminal cleavage/methylation domain-containing protein
MHSSRTPAARRGPLSPGRSQHEASRFAFTLLELLIAIAIIGILASLILQVASSASIKAHNAQVSADIQSLSAGISAFKQRFGVEPPSSITLYEQASGWSSDPRSMGLIRQIWPQFDFTYASETSNAIDINGNGTTNDTITLSGVECLVFFLGGMPTLTGAPGGPPMGFSQNPVDPFNRSGSNRISFTEFDKSRLILYTPSGGTQHTMNAYLDTLSGQTQPYLYLSSYGGQGYNLSELVGTPASSSNAPGQTFLDIYRQGSVSYWSSTSPSLVANTSTPSPAWNANSYQIISPGGDQQYGVGGEYETANANTLLVGSRAVERDNITNFSPGTLAP